MTGEALTSHEIEVLQMMTGERKGEWGAWVAACLEALSSGGYCTHGPTYQITNKGRAALDRIRSEKHD